ncbi:hypothetical protein GM418_07040 [Maribellus comscasis]|uniref:Tetratricopeptide repeat protein n=1 Tax=Maribellus comscasis TaxID=2681766 RepID=A0A6I6JTF8_9BACT|nr:hypothetical protein [Maribellus comscasis]QGY43422.1 hypothetical protein GM418_07040 [Maribellus comscasis]
MQKEELYDILNNRRAFDNQIHEDLKATVDKYPYFQTIQILYLKNLKETYHPDFEQVLKKVAVSVPDRKKLYHYLQEKHEVISNPGSISAEHEKKSVFDFEAEDDNSSKYSLIDKFLASDSGKIKRNSETDDEWQSSENEAVKKSVEEDGEIVSETLATIYLQQKKYEKAIKAFEKLSLKYPEKSVYFASRIKEIEDLKNI